MAEFGDRRRNNIIVEEKQFDERVLHVDRVARVVKGGRRFRFRALVVVGDRKGKVGIGSSKGADVTAAVTKAVEVAKKNMITVPLHNGTLPHEQEAKVSGAHILIKPARPGTGLIAGGVIRTILEVGGVSNVLSKSLGSSNKTNTAYATIEVLKAMVPVKDWVNQPVRPAQAKKVAPSQSKTVKSSPAKAAVKAKTAKV
ncbi:MAG: 30S ribosomal protein S5 [Candidatus Saccharimonadales bacterium]